MQQFHWPYGHAMRVSIASASCTGCTCLSFFPSQKTSHSCSRSMPLSSVAALAVELSWLQKRWKNKITIHENEICTISDKQHIGAKFIASLRFLSLQFIMQMTEVHSDAPRTILSCGPRGELICSCRCQDVRRNSCSRELLNGICDAVTT